MSIKPAPQNHAIAIIDEGTSCKITPGEVLAAKRDTITFHNMTDGALTIMLPDTTLFGKTNYPLGKNESLPLSIHPKAEKRIYTYTVYCSHIEQFAHASVPVIIIYDDMV